MITKINRRARIKMRIRKIVCGTPEQPRLSVFRSNKQIYAQIIDDTTGKTICSVTSLEPALTEAAKGKNKSEQAAIVGTAIAAKAKEAGVIKVAFDRNGYLFHGRVRRLAEAAKEAGLKF